jgi:hypothetical protein
MLPRDEPAEWTTPGATRLHNAGCWVYETHFMGASAAPENPYWPGGAIAIDGDGPPRLERLLGDVPLDALRRSASPPVRTSETREGGDGHG